MAKKKRRKKTYKTWYSRLAMKDIITPQEYDEAHKKPSPRELQELDAWMDTLEMVGARRLREIARQASPDPRETLEEGI